MLEWIPEEGRFAATNRDAFESYWRKSVDPTFGRLICWISFSVGAEFLAKGTCLVRGVEIRKEHDVPMYPTAEIENWVPLFLRDWEQAGTIKATHFGTLGTLVHRDKTGASAGALVQLCEKVSATSKERELVLAAYELLSKSIRNRDAHAYVPNARDSHYNLAPELFAESFNTFVSWLPGGSTALNSWRAEAETFISSL